MKNFGIVGAVAGSGVVAGGWTFWSWSWGEQEIAHTHLEENSVMKEKLKNAF